MPELTDGVRLTLSYGGRARRLSWPEVGRLSWDDFTLVCGAGGTTGASFEAGVLFALTLDHGVQLSRANEVIGTSAGSIAATLIGLGFDGSELAASIADVRDLVDPVRRAYAVRLDTDMPQTPSLLSMMDLRFPGPLPRMWRAAIRGDVRLALLRSLRLGQFDVRDHLPFLRDVEWEHLRSPVAVCAASLSTARRVVLRHSEDASLLDAVAASCSVPSVFAPVSIGSNRLVDGAVVSPTSADLAAGADSSLTVVLSPMTASTARSAGGVLSARFASSCLQRELRAFDTDRKVLVVEPTGALGRVIVDEPLIGNGHLDILRASFLAVGLAA